jgi:hypothetical protein
LCSLRRREGRSFICRRENPLGREGRLLYVWTPGFNILIPEWLFAKREFMDTV